LYMKYVFVLQKYNISIKKHSKTFQIDKRPFSTEQVWDITACHLSTKKAGIYSRPTMVSCECLLGTQYTKL
jgi:hypothetical protein